MTPLQKLPKNEADLGKLIVAKGFKKLPKVQKSLNLFTLVARVIASKRQFARGQDLKADVQCDQIWRFFGLCATF